MQLWPRREGGKEGGRDARGGDSSTHQGVHRKEYADYSQNGQLINTARRSENIFSERAGANHKEFYRSTSREAQDTV